jgi:small subunit ribosomal protein S24e
MTSLRTCTKLDPMTYLLFGAYSLRPQANGIQCDDWLPIVGDIRLLDDVHRLKKSFEGCMLRVFEGIGNGIGQKRKYGNRDISDVKDVRITRRRIEDLESGEEEEEWETEDTTNLVLSAQEVKDSHDITDGIVDILNQFADERNPKNRLY